jgi:Serine-pyruvate aminotransferase/archaeal aspartate aminotransferase
MRLSPLTQAVVWGAEALFVFNAQQSKEALSMNAIHLRIPGPTPIPPRIQQAMLAPMIGHRSGEFKRLYAEVTNGFPRFSARASACSS